MEMSQHMGYTGHRVGKQRDFSGQAYAVRNTRATAMLCKACGL